MNDVLQHVMKEGKIQRWANKPNHVLTVGVIRDSHEAIWSSTEDGMDGIYEIGSITKTFTGLLAAIGEERGLWKVSDSLASFIPEWEKHPFAGETTLRHLVTHTSGLARVPKNISKTVIDRMNPYANYRDDDLMAAVMQEKRPSRRRWNYSNYGFGLLGWLLAKRTGQRLDEMMNEWIFAPLHMAQSSVAIPSSASLLPVFKANGKSAKHWEFHDAMAGAGAVHSTVSDMLRYLEAHLRDGGTLYRALERSRQELHAIDAKRGTAMAYGWMMQREKDGSMTYWHNGATYGSCSFAMFNREKQIGLVILSNCGFSLLGELHPFKMSVDKLAKHLWTRLAGEEHR